MVERFFYLRQTDLDSTGSGIIMLLSGPPNCGKTSLLFQFAFNAAFEGNSSNRDVVFICNRRRLESKPPFLSQGIDSSSDMFRRIQMKYVDDDEGVKKFFAAFHLHDTFPAAVIVDDFGDFFDDRNCQERYGNPRGRDLAMVRTLALCQSAITHANERGPCKLVLSDTQHGDSPRLLYIYKRWVASILTITGDGSGSFTLKNNIYGGSSNSGRMRTAKYSVALQYLVLEGIAEDSEHLRFELHFRIHFYVTSFTSDSLARFSWKNTPEQIMGSRRSCFDWWTKGSLLLRNGFPWRSGGFGWC